MKKEISWTVVAVIALLIIAIAVVPRIVVAVNNSVSAEREESTARTAQVTTKEPYQYGRIVLTDQFQTIVIPVGKTCIVAPVEDDVKAVKVVNGNRNMGTMDYSRSSTQLVNRYESPDRIMTASYKAAGHPYGKSLVYVLYNEGLPEPDVNVWVGIAIAKTMR